jgi:hypothetical protein
MPHLVVPPHLRRASLLGAAGLLLLALAGLRHHLVWGESPALPFSIRPLLDAFETACLLGFVWLGGLAWLRGMTAVRQERPPIVAIVRASVPLLLAAVIVPAFFSADVTDYVMRGRIVSIHGGNPYVDVAATFTSDPFLRFGDGPWKHFPLPYGPIVADLQAAIAWLADLPGLPPLPALLLAVGLFKAVFAALLVAAAFTARTICERLRPDDRDVVFVGVLWNPLVLGEGIATAHNECLVLLTILLALRFALESRAAASVVAAGAGVLSKLVPVLLGPLLLAWSVRTRAWRGFALGAAGVLALVALYWYRYFDEPGALEFVRRQSAVIGSSPVWGVARVLEIDAATVLAFGRAIVLVVVLAASVRVWRRPDPITLLGGATAILAAMVAFGTAGFGPWYHVWWIPVATIVGSGFLYRFAIAASLTSLLGYAVWTSLRTLDPRHEWLLLSMGLLVPLLLAIVWRPRARERTPVVAPPAGSTFVGSSSERVPAAGADPRRGRVG